MKLKAAYLLHTELRGHAGDVGAGDDDGALFLDGGVGGVDDLEALKAEVGSCVSLRRRIDQHGSVTSLHMKDILKEIIILCINHTYIHQSNLTN